MSNVIIVLPSEWVDYKKVKLPSGEETLMITTPALLPISLSFGNGHEKECDTYKQFYAKNIDGHVRQKNGEILGQGIQINKVKK